ncbi:filamentous hemagglutinin N-terminal domain-containing protein [Pseudomonas sp. TNT11]|uniref:Filamentous hemagglutinin N-terminal domain-containing protein n=1 Tax=Pseudomonas emilianonis TaxID=2915812 RepID=A0ABT0ELW9_9PSED|nr:filamentous hemagglutinin N-terminal domain-containing protein [Pseudomonas emilianonis]MCK1786724.1 filamentous hemagglutinin N-terminal domain-containing protein [Pseudomonas emilianonis]
MNIKLTLMALSLAAATSALAAPVNPVVVNGHVTFTQDGNALTVTNSPNAIINWSSFSIAQGELVRFQQQSSSSSVLNRITGQDPSVILGTLQSNGRVYLINPNGIVFGGGSQINVGGLVASSLAISNADFLAGNRRFAADGAAGQVSNQGAITTPSGGQVYLIAPDVNNSGIITTPQGETVLAAGHSVQLVDSSNPGMHVVVSAEKDQALNLGTVIAQGGNIGIYGALVNQRGTLNANSAVVGAGGKVVLKSSGSTLLEAGSTTTATGVDCGGDIQVLGEQVGVMGNARIDASGQRGGGRVLVGGDYQGKNWAVLNAKQSYVSKDARISADALASGDGGKIIVWGNDTTRVYGTLSARGGAASGKGGFVETSGHFLDVAGARVDTRAANGTAGFWQLDPANILVTSFLSGPSASLGDVSAFANAPGADSEIDADLLSNATSNVLLQATHDITFYTGVNNTNDGVSLTAQAGNNINVNSLIHFNGDITLAANHNGAGTASGSGRVSTEGVPTAGGRLTITDVDRLPVPEPVTVPASVPTEPVAVALNSTLTVIMNQGTSGIAGPDDLPRMIASNSPKAPDDKSTTTPNNDTQASKNDSLKTSYCN